MSHHVHLPLVTLLVAGLASATAFGAQPTTGLLPDVTFNAMPTNARNGELLRRLVSPLQAQRISAALGNRPDALGAPPLDPHQQRFALYVPPTPPPPAGYALLVFVPPWKQARVPVQWIPVLNRTHTIFITAADSGNDANVLNRRDPLALLATAGAMRHYRINPAQVFIGGFSGGSRVALRLALGYPDVFHGALLDAGSDPIGTAAVPLPPTDLLHRFQESSRIVFLTGDADFIRRAQLAHASDALKHWCVFQTRSVTLLNTPHVLASVAEVAEALAWLRQTSRPDPARITACRANRQTDLAASMAELRDDIASGDTQRALQGLHQVDDEYGNLATPTTWQELRAINALSSQPAASRH